MSCVSEFPSVLIKAIASFVIGVGMVSIASSSVCNAASLPRASSCEKNVVILISLPDIFCIKAMVDINLSASFGSLLPISTRIFLAVSLFSSILSELINSEILPGSCKFVVALIKASSSVSFPANISNRPVAVAVGICPEATMVFILTSKSLLSSAAAFSKNVSAKAPCPCDSAFIFT